MWIVGVVLLVVASVNVCLAQEPEPGNRLQVMPSSQVQEKAINTSILLTCMPQVNDISLLKNLRWLGPDNQEIRSDVRKYTEELMQHNRGLIIRTLEKSDSGVYKCVASYDGSPLEVSVEIKSFVDITWEDCPMKQYPVANGEGLIKCRVFADPIPDIYWYKNDYLFKADERCRIEEDGIRCNPITEEDDGAYSCRARVSVTGRVGDRTINVKVYTKPAIENLESQYEAVEDESLRLRCDASGNPPPSYSWLDNNEEDFNGQDGYEVNEVDGTLVIHKLKSSDAGVITCLAKNEAGTDRKDVTVMVIVKPQIQKFENLVVTEENNALLECIVMAEPSPKVTFINEGTQVEYTSGFITSDGNIKFIDHVEPDLSKENVALDKVYALQFKSITTKDDGLYRCVAVNNGGRVEQTAHLQVEFAPKISSSSTTKEYSWMNNTPAHLHCNTSGIPNATITWYYTEHLNPELIVENANIKIVSSGSNSTLEISSNDQMRFGKYMCRAENRLGNKTHSMELVEAETPKAIMQAIFGRVTANTITFKLFGPSDDGGFPVTGFVVTYRDDLSEWDTTDVKERIWAINSPYILEKLEPEKTFIFKFAAMNKVGIGEWSEEYTQTMPKKAAPEEPLITSSTEGSQPNSYQVSWEVPEDNGEKIVSFEITYYPVKNVSSKIEKAGDMKTETVQHPGVTSYVIEGLSANTLYKIEIRATNQIGNSQPSTVVIKTVRDRSSVSVTTSKMEDLANELQASMGVPIEVIIGIAVASLLLVIIIIDVGCYVTNKCGILMFLCVHICKKHPPSDKVKEANMEEGKSKDSKDNKKSNKTSHNVEDDEAKDATEETPMIADGKLEKEQEANKIAIDHSTSIAKDSAV